MLNYPKLEGKVVSADPVYQFTVKQIRARIDTVYPQIMKQMSSLPHTNPMGMVFLKKNSTPLLDNKHTKHTVSPKNYSQ